MQQASSACRVQLDAASFLLASATLSLEEIGALMVLATVCAGSGGIQCTAEGVPITRALGEHLERLWPKVKEFFLREGDRVLPDPRCPCRSAKTAGAKRKDGWVGVVPGPLGVAWAAWIRYRREDKRIPVTQHGGDMALKKLSAMDEKRAIATIENSIENQYQGLFEPNENRFKKPEAPKPAGCAACSTPLRGSRTRTEFGDLCALCAMRLPETPSRAAFA